MPTVALIEDEDGIADFVQRGLARAGLRVRIARDGDAGLELALRDEVDLVVLDLMLPQRSGVEILEALQAERPWVPVIVLTARGALEDRLAGLRGGAVDYIVKPFVLAELEARIQSQLRVARQMPDTTMRYGDLTIDLLARRLTHGDRTIRLSTTEFELLAYFVQNVGTLLTRAQLRRAVWGYRHELSTNLVDVYVGYLRRKVSGPDGPLLNITAVRSRGYRLEPAA
ncbi:MAG TPA: response regulator transcription factor [Solirubrobacteraceae bacterium]|nr:response regulator transcription factor [Solirubrobacteraceae bacterium]